MKRSYKIEKMVHSFFLRKKSEVKTTLELDKRIIDDALPAYEDSLKKKSASIQPNIGRIIMKNKMVKLTAATIIIVVFLAFHVMDAPIDGTGKIFAAAMDSIKRARTFSCVLIWEVGYEDNHVNGKYLSKDKIMFKEPYWERREQITSPWPQYVGEITIHDYDKRQELILRPANKEAILYDLSSSYTFDGETGELRLTMLDTSLRDYLLEKSMGTFDDLGEVELDGQIVWKLQGKKKNRICTLWINPETNYPVQIELRHSEQNRPPVLYTSIQIDSELDDDLFSLIPPEDYYLRNLGNGGWEDYQRKLSAKIKQLGLYCVIYQDKNENQFPEELSELVISGIVTDEILKNILAPPDNPEGQPVFRYRKPEKDSDWSTTIILYEAYNKWPDEGVVVCIADGHSEIIKDQSLFEELIK